MQCTTAAHLTSICCVPLMYPEEYRALQVLTATDTLSESAHADVQCSRRSFVLPRVLIV